MLVRPGCGGWSGTWNNYCNSWWAYGLFDWETGSPTFGNGVVGCNFTDPEFNCINPNRTWAVSLWSLDGWNYATQYNWTLTLTYETVSAPTAINGTSTICAGSPTTLTASGGSASAGSTAINTQWFSGSCGGTLVGTGNSITVSPTSTTTYFARRVGQCSTTGCASITVTVDQPSSAAASVSGAGTTVCLGTALTLTVQGGALVGQSYWQWFSGSCTGTPVGTGASISVTPSATTSYFVYASANGALSGYVLCCWSCKFTGTIKYFVC